VQVIPGSDLGIKIAKGQMRKVGVQLAKDKDDC
jgi:hypothetical protein